MPPSHVGQAPWVPPASSQRTLRHRRGIAFGIEGAKLRDPRAANAQHDLLEILVIAMAPVRCGAQSAAEMALFGRSKEAPLRQVLRLEHGIRLAIEEPWRGRRDDEAPN